MMELHLFLEPTVVDQEPLEDYLPAMPTEPMRRRGLARRRLEAQRELKELEANLHDVLNPHYDPQRIQGNMH
ncbi:MAG: hypothetical protein ACFCVA_14975 [Gammaproteobacteria bacterium]